ncbi:MAG: hypothetical protein IJZ06_07550 [Bacteroidales bacterium]|nr:hypothetical protein [Bacteroidales bacterium]
MKTLKLLFFCLAIFSTFNANAQKQTTIEYDKTIDKLIPKAKKNKLNDEKINELTISYHQANEIDHMRIMELKATGEPDIWIEIYYRINNINKRQEKIKVLPENVKKVMNYKHLNLENEINNSKEKAELYLCAKINLLLKNPTEENLNESSVLVNHLIKINPQNSNIDDFRLKLVVLPSKQILFRVATPTELYLPDNFAQLALNFDERTIYGIPFDIVPIEKTEYDLMIRIMIEKKIISPNRIDAVTFEEKSGDLVAKVTDKTMSKSVTIKGEIEFIDVEKENILIATPFDIASTFVYNYAELSGDKAACSAHTLELLDKQVIDFPSDEALLKDVARKLNMILKSRYQKK